MVRDCAKRVLLAAGCALRRHACPAPPLRRPHARGLALKVPLQGGIQRRVSKKGTGRRRNGACPQFDAGLSPLSPFSTLGPLASANSRGGDRNNMPISAPAKSTHSPETARSRRRERRDIRGRRRAARPREPACADRTKEAARGSEATAGENRGLSPIRRWPAPSPLRRTRFLRGGPSRSRAPNRHTAAKAPQTQV